MFLGEDWKDSALMLSTVASDMFAKSVPYLWVSKIQPGKLWGFGMPGGKANNANGGFAKQFAQPQQQQQPQPQSNTLFGQQASAQAPGFGLFGQSQAQSNSPFSQQAGAQAPSFGLFGQSQAQSNSPFSQQAGAQAPSFGVFGAAAAPPASGGLFGGTSTSTFGTFTEIAHATPAPPQDD